MDYNGIPLLKRTRLRLNLIKDVAQRQIKLPIATPVHTEILLIDIFLLFHKSKQMIKAKQT